MSKMIQCEICKNIVTPQEARYIQGFYYNSEFEREKDRNMRKDICRICYSKIFHTEKNSLAK